MKILSLDFHRAVCCCRPLFFIVPKNQALCCCWVCGGLICNSTKALFILSFPALIILSSWPWIQTKKLSSTWHSILIVNRAVKFNLEAHALRSPTCTPVLVGRRRWKATLDVLYKVLWDCGKPNVERACVQGFVRGHLSLKQAPLLLNATKHYIPKKEKLQSLCLMWNNKKTSRIWNGVHFGRVCSVKLNSVIHSSKVE